MSNAARPLAANGPRPPVSNAGGPSLSNTLRLPADQPPAADRPRLPVPSPPPRATAIPRNVPAKVVSVRTAVGRADVVRPPSVSRPVATNLAAWNGPTASMPAAPAAPHGTGDRNAPTVEQHTIQARTARDPDPSRRPH
jgi:hypothetical protein